MRSSPCILIAGGGSLGYVYPGLSIARRIRQQIPSARITFVGDGRAIERHTVRAAGLPYTSTPNRETLRSIRETPSFLARSAAGWCVANWLLIEREPDLVICVGGHASAPMGRAARAAGVPYVLLEQNTSPTAATTSLARDAYAVCVGLPDVVSSIPIGASVVHVGGIGRPDFEDAFATQSPARLEDSGRPRLVVLGGVAGASSLNQAMPLAAAQIRRQLADWQIVHQSGSGWLSKTEDKYRVVGVEATVVSYIDQLAHLASASDLFVCRPGGSTLAELALAGMPAVLVPDSRRKDALHETNAQLAQQRYGCLVVEERGGQLEQSLAAALESLVGDTSRRELIASRIRADRRPKASQHVAEIACRAIQQMPQLGGAARAA